MYKYLIKLHCWLFPYKLSEIHGYMKSKRRRQKIRLLMENTPIFIEKTNHPTWDEDSAYQMFNKLIEDVEKVA